MPRRSDNRAKLTARSVEAAAFPSDVPASRRVLLYDTEIPGFALRLRSTGSKAFVLRYWTGEVERFLTLGDWPALTVDQARRMARERLGEVAAGADPMAERQAQRDAMTVAELAKVYFDEYAKPHKKSWRQDQSRINGRILPAWGPSKADSLKRPEVAAWLKSIGDAAPYEANRVQALMRKMYEWGAAQGYISEGHFNPAKGIRQFRERPRERYVKPDELRRLVAAVEAESDPAHRAYFLGLLLTGCRRSELLNARWDDVLSSVDGSKVLRLADTKNGEFRNVPLPAAFVELLDELPRFEGNPYVFASRVVQGAPMDVPRKPWDRIRAAAGLEDVHLHDLRATVGTLMASAGESAFHIKKVLGHKSDAAVKVYVRLGEDAAKAASDRHAARMAAILGGGQ